MHSSPHRRKPSVLMRLLKVLYILLVIISLIIVAVYAAFRLWVKPPDVDSQVTFHPDPVFSDPVDDPSVTDDPQVTPEPTPTPLVLTRRDGVYTCLLLGVADMGGSDTIMLGVFDTQGKTASLVSIPRDTLVNVNGDRKINSTYSIGGTELISETVSSMLGVPVDYCLSVNFQGFKAIVDTIGGVWFTVPVDMDYEDPYQDLSIHISAGYQKLNGEQAVGVMRCRSCYPSADIGRVQTQRAFLTALVDQTITLSNVTKVTSLIKILNSYVDTDMPLDTMIYFATQAIGMDLGSALSSATLPGEWDGVHSVYQLDDDKVLELVNSLGIYQEEMPMEALNIRHK